MLTIATDDPDSRRTRLEIRTILEEIIRRIPDIRLDGPAQRLRLNFINGIKSMPVAFSPEPGRGGAP